MGLFDSILKKKETGIIIGSPADGTCIPLSEVSDPTFAEGILGNGVAIVPTKNQIVAPSDGTIEMIFKTAHAFSMTTSDGVEILVHIGIDTVKLDGLHFTKCSEDGAEVKKGDVIIEADLEEIKKAGYDTTIPIIICNTGDYKDVKAIASGNVHTTEDILQIVKQ